ncbi:MFS transporter [Thiovibrio frasassiensis]|uniref:MFS transporter n=1 Tax=Thiovibrio frasassiensis TaxID=2984131 RepID=A0A9X4MDR9_9BACT|nr:MFS transporter [Thiovibrio frasassiensis]MDG4475471.1 MFS transporter [Thiovibrio frasassiensis]
MADCSPQFEKATFDKVAWRLIPLLFCCYIVAFLDRVNIGFAKLQMAPELGFSDAVYGFGAGIFFIGYFLFEVPSNIILQRVGARLWIARIMITWGIISASFVFVDAIHWGGLAEKFNCTDPEFTFYFLRFLLGASEAGFFPGVILYLTYWFPATRRAGMVARFMTAIAISSVLGSPLSGAILEFLHGAAGWRGWQWLFLLEGIPSVFVGLLVFLLLPDTPERARWLTAKERELVVRRVAEDEALKRELGLRSRFQEPFCDGRVWALCLVYFCGVVCFYAISFWMPTIIQDAGLNKNDYLEIGLLAMIPWGLGAVAMVRWGSHSDYTGERRWHSAAGLFCATLGLLGLMAAGRNVGLGILALSLVTVGLLSWMATFWALPTGFLSGTAAAAGIAWINSVGNLGGQVGPYLLGHIRTATGGADSGAFLALAGFALLGALVTLMLPNIRAR